MNIGPEKAMAMLRRSFQSAQGMLRQGDQVGASNEIRQLATELDLLLNGLANDLVHTAPQRGRQAEGFGRSAAAALAAGSLALGTPSMAAAKGKPKMSQVFKQKQAQRGMSDAEYEELVRRDHSGNIEDMLSPEETERLAAERQLRNPPVAPNDPRVVRMDFGDDGRLKGGK